VRNEVNPASAKKEGFGNELTKRWLSSVTFQINPKAVRKQLFRNENSNRKEWLPIGLNLEAAQFWVMQLPT
jgi:hypothetical protein